MTITWDSPDELEEYISRLQSAADRLTSENRRLRKCHGTLVDKVCPPKPLYTILGQFAIHMNMYMYENSIALK